MGPPLRHGQRWSGTHYGQLGLGLLPFIAQREAEEDVAIEPGGFFHASRHLVGLGQRQLKIRVAGNGVCRMLVKNPQRRLGIVLLQGEIGNHHRQTANEDAFRIFGGEAGQERFGVRELARFHVRLGGQKIGVVVHGRTRGVGFPEAGGGFGIAMIQQVGVAQGEVRRGACFSGVSMGIGRHPGIGRGRAHGGQFLGHRPQLRRGDKGPLQFAAAGNAPGAARFAPGFDVAHMTRSRLAMGGRGGRMMRSRRSMLRRRRRGLQRGCGSAYNEQQSPGQKGSYCRNSMDSFRQLVHFPACSGFSYQLIPNKTLSGKFGCEQAFVPPPAPTEPNQIPLPAHIGSDYTDGGADHALFADYAFCRAPPCPFSMRKTRSACGRPPDALSIDVPSLSSASTTRTSRRTVWKGRISEPV